MKKTLLILFLAITALTSCKKDPEDKLKGRWNLVKHLDVTRVNGTISSESTHDYEVEDFYIVFDGNKYKVYQDGDLDGEGTFTATDNAITITDKDGDQETNALRWNSKTEFVMIDEDTETVNGASYNYKYEATFRKN